MRILNRVEGGPILTVGILILTGCASMEKSVMFGAGMGASVGTGSGIANEKSVGSALIGAGIGAVLGGALGYLGHKEKEKEDILKGVAHQIPKGPSDTPMLSAPQASCYKVDEKVTGTEYVGPHLRCTIEKNSVWSLQ